MAMRKRSLAGVLAVCGGILATPATSAAATEMMSVVSLEVTCVADGLRVVATGRAESGGWGDIRLLERGRVGTTRSFALVGTAPDGPATQAIDRVRVSKVMQLGNQATRIAVTASGSVRIADIPETC